MEGRESNSAFTLIELLIVITMIGILAGIAIVRYGPMAENARAAEAWTVLSQVKDSENVNRLENNVYTANWNLLDRFDAPGPASTNFVFSIPNFTLNTGYARAARICPATTGCGPRRSYGMRFRDGCRCTCNLGVCNPTANCAATCPP